MAKAKSKARKRVVHVGFETASRKAAAGAGVSVERGRAIIAASTRKAKRNKAAVKRNPRLLRVKG